MNLPEIITLNNDIKLIYKKNPKTPRIAINIFFDAGVKLEEKPGIASIVGRLFMQGTNSRSAEDIASELESNAIEVCIDVKQDYTKIKSVFLNEDIDKALEIISDLIINSTFANWEKEIRKFKGELEVELDSPRTKAIDNLVKNIYSDNPYGHTYTKILNTLQEIDLSSIKEYYNTSFASNNMTIVVIGDIEKDKAINLINEKFKDMKKSETLKTVSFQSSINENKLVTIEKNDAAQAQIVKGWLAPNITDEDYAALSLLNIILGASGLSSRLFVELRDKKGLAYHVRSTLEPLKYSGTFSVYIGTSPNNIKTCLEGFDIEIDKLKNTIIPESELEDAKNNYLGKRAFYHETNAQQAHYLGYYDIMGLGCDYDSKIPELIKKVTTNDIKEVANKYLSQNHIISILAPQEYLKDIQ